MKSTNKNENTGHLQGIRRYSVSRLQQIMLIVTPDNDFFEKLKFLFSPTKILFYKNREYFHIQHYNFYLVQICSLSIRLSNHGNFSGLAPYLPFRAQEYIVPCTTNQLN